MDNAYSLSELKETLRSRKLDRTFYSSLDQPKQVEACEKDIARLEREIIAIQNNTED